MNPAKRNRLLLALILVIGAGIYVGVKDARKEKLRADFSTFSLAASRVMFSGGDPYDKEQVEHNYKYFPTNAILLWPFTLISVYTAQGIWYALNLALVIWAFVALRSMLRPIKIPWWVYILTLTISFRLIVMNLRLGQWNTSVFCLSIIGLQFILDGKRWGAWLLSLAITLKFMPVIFLGYFAVRRRWKDLGMTALATVFWIFILPLIVLGPSRTTELMQKYYSGSVSRVGQMTTGENVSSLSLHSTIYRALTPITVEIKDRYFRSNIVNLSRETAGNIAKGIGLIILVSGFMWMARQHRRDNEINPVGELLLIGLCYLMWFLAMPGVRHAQLISIIPLGFAIAAAIQITPERSTRVKLLAGYAFIFILYTSPAEFVDKTVYNNYLEASGVMSWGLVMHTILGLYAYYTCGHIPLRREVLADQSLDDSR